MRNDKQVVALVAVGVEGEIERAGRIGTDDADGLGRERAGKADADVGRGRDIGRRRRGRGGDGKGIRD